jgi:mannosyltransferase
MISIGIVGNVIGDRAARPARSLTGPADVGATRQDIAGARQDIAAAACRLAGRSSRPRLVAWLVVLIPAAAELAVGGYRLGGASLWRDEGYTIEAAQRSVGQIFALTGHIDLVHGPYYLFMHFVVGALGISEVAVRLPALLGMSAAAGMIAALGRRLAVNSALPAPSVIGVLAGLLFVAVPQTTFYAQDARPYGLTTLFAVTASYLLVRAAADGRWGWWAGYAAAIVVTTLSSLLALLLIVAHGVTVLTVRAQAARRADGRAQTPAGGGAQAQTDSPADAEARTEPPADAGARAGSPVPSGSRPWRANWLLAAAGALLVLSPFIVLAYRQSGILSWIGRPGWPDVQRLAWDFAGSKSLLPLVAVVALAGVASGVAVRRSSQPTLATVALPWLVLPPLIMMLASQVRPIYVERYVSFCVPAVALLVAAGLGWLARQVTRIPLASGWPVAAWLPSVILVVALAVMVTGPQQRVRLTAARADNLRKVAAIVSAHERQGDAVFYGPVEARLISFSYPAPYLRLRDIALAGPVAASVTLTGVEVPAATLRSRFAGLTRVWLVTWASALTAGPSGPTGREEYGLLKEMRLAQRWHVRSVVLSLYVRSGG